MQKGPIEEDVYLVVRTLLQPVFQTVMTVDRTSELAVSGLVLFDISSQSKLRLR